MSTRHLLAIALALLLTGGAGPALAEPETDADADPPAAAAEPADEASDPEPAAEPEAASEAEAASASPVDDTWQRIMNNLASDRFEVRQRQTRELLRDTEVDLATVRRMYEQAERSEQRHRLRAVLRHHVLRRYREGTEPSGGGALGISHRGLSAEQAGEIGRPMVEVLATMAGMPAYVALEPGDLIVGFDGEDLEAAPEPEQAWDHRQARPQPVHVAVQAGPQNVAARLSQLIQRRRPGSEVELTIIRDGRERRVRVTLTGHDALRTMYHPQTRRLQGDYATQWTRVRDRLEARGEPVNRIDLDVDPQP